MKADTILLQITYCSVMETFAIMGNISNRKALDLFYKSQIYQEMRDGVSYMHCRSEKYLAEDLIQEFGMGTKTSHSGTANTETGAIYDI